MAAKVVMVAVPTVLGIASIRVYTVSEAPTDGLVTRERLNIYTPLPPSTQVTFVPESPGAIESGLTIAREGILPVVQAVKSVCISVKRGSINLYHAGEDVFYYLKDPPPGFLPRFGTITMAGLLGMFLARKGSRFKRVAVPLGLMSAGASVCYPAQAVSVLKVSGKKVYAAGQWSGAAVSSLFASKEPVAKELVASQPQSATEPNPDSAVAQEASTTTTETSAIPEKEVESAESIPISDEPIVAVTPAEESSVTVTEISPDQTSTEPSADPLLNSVPVETETSPPSEELPAPVEGKDAKPAAEDVSSVPSLAEAAPSSAAETIEAAPVASVSAEAAPVESVEAVPVESVEASPVEAAPVEAAPVEAVPVESVEAAPVEAAPVESVEAAPVEATPVEAAPVESVEAAPVEAAPVEAAPVESVEAAPVEAAPVEAAPVEAAPSSEETSAPLPSEEPAVPVVESAAAVEPESADQPPPAAAVEETPALTPPPLQQPAAEHSKDGSGFKPDPSLMDFGQSNPEDEDLYTTRS